MQLIPLQAKPNQTLNVVLGGQQVNINLYTPPQTPAVDVNTWLQYTSNGDTFGTGNGKTTAFYLASTTSRAIQRMNGAVTVDVNGVPTAVTIANNGLVTFSVAPAVNAVLTFIGSYFYRNVMPVMISPALLMDVAVNNMPICTAIPCFNLNKIVRDAYLGFIGDFIFNDTMGTNDPDYTGLDGRYELIYLEASDL